VGQQLLLLVAGFVLTSALLGGLLGYFLQSRAWAHQHDVQRRDEERQQALKTFEEVSLLLDRRLYRMRRVYWAARRKARGTGDGTGLTSAQDDYREVLAAWNDNLNRALAIVETYFGSPTRAMLEDEDYEEFTVAGRGLEEIVRMVLAAGDERIDVPPFGYRVTRLSHRVYDLNVRMLRQLEDETIVTYDHFIQSVLLPQGRFADFLQAEPSKRQALLVELLAFGVYKKVGQQARDRARLAAERARLALEHRAKLADATEEAEERAAARVRDLEELGQGRGVASNAGNWQWVAGTGHNTRPSRIMNPLRQAQRFDPAGDPLRPRTGRPAPGPRPHPVAPGPAARRRLGYPDPLVDLIFPPAPRYRRRQP
jgi:FAD binding domain of DNA photolyase